MLFRPLHRTDLEKGECLEGASYIYSLWEGYWERDSFDDVKGWLKNNSIEKVSVHTSGHASIKDLQKLEKAINPEMVVPIHSFYPEQYDEVFQNVKKYNDGEWWEV